MAYTPFAILLGLVMLSFAANPPLESNMNLYPVEERYSLESSIEQTQQSYALKSLQNLANISKNQDVSNFNSSITNLFVNGSYLTHDQSRSMNSLQNQYKRSSGILKQLKVSEVDISITNITMKTGSKLVLGFKGYNTTTQSEHSSKVRSVDDPLLTNIGYETEINSCNYEKLAVKYSSIDYNGTARGEPVIEPSNINMVSDKDEKIVVSSDITSYNPSYVDNYAGYVSETNPSSPGDYNNNHATGLTLPTLEDEQRVIIHEGMWLSNIYKTISNQCYLRTPQIATPTIPERIENKTRGTSFQGVYTVINTSEVAKDFDQSNIGYERVDKPSNLVNITGVTKTDGIEWQYFRMNESTAKYSGLEKLIK